MYKNLMINSLWDMMDSDGNWVVDRAEILEVMKRMPKFPMRAQAFISLVQEDTKHINVNPEYFTRSQFVSWCDKQTVNDLRVMFQDVMLNDSIHSVAQQEHGVSHVLTVPPLTERTRTIMMELGY